MSMRLVWSALLVLSLGCSALFEEEAVDAGVGPITVSLDIDDDVAIGTLTPAQHEAVCEALDDAIEAGVPQAEMCDVGGLLAAAGKSMEGLDAARVACDDVVEPCRLAVRLGGSFDTPDLPLECALFRGDTGMCNSTVGELEVCLGHLATATASSISALSCASLSAEGLAEAGSTVVGESVPDDPSCARLAAECPGVFGSGEGGPDAGPPPG